jgi:hypothetical protein
MPIMLGSVSASRHSGHIGGGKPVRVRLVACLLSLYLLAACPLAAQDPFTPAPPPPPAAQPPVLPEVLPEPLVDPSTPIAEPATADGVTPDPPTPRRLPPLPPDPAAPDSAAPDPATPVQNAFGDRLDEADALPEAWVENPPLPSATPWQEPIVGNDPETLQEGMLPFGVEFGEEGEYPLLAEPLIHPGQSGQVTPERFYGRSNGSRFSQWAFGAADRLLATRQRVDAGMGMLWAPHAPLILDTTQPRHQLRFRTDFGFGLQFPDRNEYYWAADPVGPGYQGEVDTRQFAFMFEIGSDAFSVQTEFPIQGYSPEFGGGHSAFGDIRITQKTRMLDAERLQIAQMFRLHTPSGNKRIGAGTGHVSMEPGVLARYRYTDWTYFHGELKYWLPVGGNPETSGDVLTYGFGLSTVWYETLCTAIIPTLEMQSINFLEGQKTGPFGDIRVDDDNTAMLMPGLRFMRDQGGDIGAIDCGVGLGFGFSHTQYYDSLLRFELRFTR